MSKLTKEQIQELSMNIIKDSKRRTVYYHAIKKEGYILNESDRKYVALYSMRFLIALMIPLILSNFLPNLLLLWIALGFLIYFAIQYLFQHLFINKKVPIKVSEKDRVQLYDLAVLKNNRTMQRYQSGLTGILAVYITTMVFAENAPYNWITAIIAIGTIGFIFIHQLMGLFSASNQYKIAKQENIA